MRVAHQANYRLHYLPSVQSVGTVLVCKRKSLASVSESVILQENIAMRESCDVSQQGGKLTPKWKLKGYSLGERRIPLGQNLCSKNGVK